MIATIPHLCAAVIALLCIFAGVFVLFCAGLPENRDPGKASQTRRTLLVLLTIFGIALAVLFTGCKHVPIPGVDQHEHRQ
jgi:hypothetical protein